MSSLESWLAAAAVTILAGCAGAAPLPPRAIELNRLGVEALERGDLETADARFALALEFHPRFVDALVNLGLVELQRGNFARARALLTRARKLNPDVAQPHHGLGVLKEREGRPARAAGHYRDALAVDPGFPAARANLARVLLEARALEHALLQYRRLVEVAPDAPEGHAGLVECLVQLSRWVEADEALAVGLARHPEEPRLVLLDARRLLRRGAVRGALARLAPLTRQEDDVGVAARGFEAIAWLAAGDAPRALESARAALALDPADPVARRARQAASEALAAPEGGREPEKRSPFDRRR